MFPNICQCGAQDGYPHAEDCPYPFFGNYEKGIVKWEAAHARKVFQMKYGFDPETVRFARENEFWDLVDEHGKPVELPAVYSEGESNLTMLAPDLGWVCGKCKTFNKDGISLCGFCDTPRLSG